MWAAGVASTCQDLDRWIKVPGPYSDMEPSQEALYRTARFLCAGEATECDAKGDDGLRSWALAALAGPSMWCTRADGMMSTGCLSISPGVCAMRAARCFSKRALQVQNQAAAPAKGHTKLEKLQTGPGPWCGGECRGVQSDVRSAAAAMGRLGACGLVWDSKGQGRAGCLGPELAPSHSLRLLYTRYNTIIILI